MREILAQEGISDAQPHMAVLQRQERDKEVNKVFLQEMAGAKAAVCNQDPKLHGVYLAWD